MYGTGFFIWSVMVFFAGWLFGFLSLLRGIREAEERARYWEDEFNVEASKHRSPQWLERFR
jgi:hypothetical protein